MFTVADRFVLHVSRLFVPGERFGFVVLVSILSNNNKVVFMFGEKVNSKHG